MRLESATTKLGTKLKEDIKNHQATKFEHIQEKRYVSMMN